MTASSPTVSPLVDVSAAVDQIQGAWGARVAAGIRRLAEPPDWLTSVADPGRVSQALRHWVPELASGAVRLLETDPKRLRIKQETWTSLYRLTVKDSRTGRQRVVRVRGTLLPAGWEAPQPGSNGGPLGARAWRCYLPELRLDLRQEPAEDAALPALGSLTDPAEARGLLEHAIRACSPNYSDLRIARCIPRVMRYKPGSRCTILYHLEFPPESHDSTWPTPVVAKTHQGDKGRNAYEGMRGLWGSRLGSSPIVRIAEPLAFLPDLNVLVQGPVPEDVTLRQLVESGVSAGHATAVHDLAGHVEKTALGLAELHACGVHARAARTWEDEAAEIDRLVARLSTPIPELSQVATPLLSRLRALSIECPADPSVPSHGSFRPAQVLIQGGGIGFIDFDGFCRAEPAQDLALFRATVKDVGLRALHGATGADEPTVSNADALAMLGALGDCFLASYRQARALSPRRVWLWEALYVLTGLLHCWTKGKFELLPHRMLLLQQHLCSGLPPHWAGT